MRGFRSFIDWGIMNFSYFIQGEGEKLGVGWSTLDYITQFLFVFEEVYLAHYVPTM